MAPEPILDMPASEPALPPSSTDREAELVTLMVGYQAGALAAFERLYAALAPEVAALLASLHHERQSVRDLVQETFLELHCARRTYRPPLPVRPWVFGVARNVLRRHRRASARRTRLEAPSPLGVEATAPVSTPGGAPAIDLARALARLPEGKRRAWLLHHGEGLSFKEIARRLGIGEGNAKLRSSRAMSALRAMLGVRRGGDGEEPIDE